MHTAPILTPFLISPKGEKISYFPLGGRSGRDQEYGVVPATLGLEVKKDIPGIEKAARLMRTGSPVKEGLNIFPTQVSYIDPEFLDIFTFPIVIGDKKSIENQANVLISSTMAAKLFGKEYPIGKTISIVNDKNKEFTYTVGAVFADLPENSSFRIDILSHFDNFKLMWEWTDADWENTTTALFIQIPDKSLLPSITQSLKNYVPVQNRAREDFRITRFSLIPLKEVGANTRTTWASGRFPSLHPAAIMATLLSLIGMYNLVSLDIIRRTKEMGIRKIQGASVPLIMYLVSRRFLVVLVIASFLGCAGGYYMSNMLMDSIWDYFVQIKPGILILAASIMFVATLLTIIFKIGKAALRNHVDSLRYE